DRFEVPRALPEVDEGALDDRERVRLRALDDVVLETDGHRVDEDALPRLRFLRLALREGRDRGANGEHGPDGHAAHRMAAHGSRGYSRGAGGARREKEGGHSAKDQFAECPSPPHE